MDFCNFFLKYFLKFRKYKPFKKAAVNKLVGETFLMTFHFASVN